MKVSHFSFSSTGGAGISVARIARAQAVVGIEPTVRFAVSGNIQNQGLASPIRTVSALVDYFLVRNSLQNPLFSLVRSGATLDCELDKTDADLTHLHWIPGAVSLGALSTHLARPTPMFWTLQDMWAFTGGCHHHLGCSEFELGCSDCPQARVPFHRLIEAAAKKKRLILESDNLHVTVPSDWMRSLIERAVPEIGSLHTVGNPIDTETYSPSKDSAAVRSRLELAKQDFLIVICAADLSVPGKQVENFAKLLKASLGRFGRTVRLLAVGKNPPRFLEHQSWVTIMSASSDKEMASLFAAADVLVSASVAEAFGYTIAEAGACGTPTVTLAAGGTAESVIPGRSGFVVESMQEIIEKVLILESMGPEAKEMGNAARTHIVDRFSERAIGQAFHDLYGTVLDP